MWSSEPVSLVPCLPVTPVRRVSLYPSVRHASLPVTHGVVAGNAVHKFQGQKNSPLTGKGRDGASRVGLRLRYMQQPVRKYNIYGIFWNEIERAASSGGLRKLASCIKDIQRAWHGIYIMCAACAMLVHAER